MVNLWLRNLVVIGLGRCIITVADHVALHPSKMFCEKWDDSWTGAQSGDPYLPATTANNPRRSFR